MGTEGCACSVEGATVDCGTVEARSGDNVVCLRGKRSCTNGVWGTCAGDQRVQIYAPLGRPGLGAQSLAGSSTSCGNVCDPDCQTFVDTPASLTPGTGLSADAAGLSLTPTGGLGGGTCSNIIISASPSASTLTVTSFSPLVTTPASLTFTATCGVGGPTISPTWTISSADSAIASIDSATGVFAAHAGVAKDVTVTALSAIGTATAVAHIKVQIDVDDAGTCATTAIKNQFSTTATGGTDPGLIMYPYPIAARPVVFPLNLTAPLLQWNTGARTATCVKVSLNYPSGSASPTFHWGKLASGEPKQGTLDTTQPAFVIDQTAWANFSTSARAAS